jgi:hypothetical protein
MEHADEVVIDNMDPTDLVDVSINGMFVRLVTEVREKTKNRLQTVRELNEVLVPGFMEAYGGQNEQLLKKCVSSDNQVKPGKVLRLIEMMIRTILGRMIDSKKSYPDTKHYRQHFNGICEDFVSAILRILFFEHEEWFKGVGIDQFDNFQPKVPAADYDWNNLQVMDLVKWMTIMDMHKLMLTLHMLHKRGDCVLLNWWDRSDHWDNISRVKLHGALIKKFSDNGTCWVSSNTYLLFNRSRCQQKIPHGPGIPDQAFLHDDGEVQENASVSDLL